MHYARFLRHGSPHGKTEKKCNANDCKTVVSYAEYCKYHSNNFYKHGSAIVESMVKCQSCKREIVRKGSRHKYCDDCIVVARRLQKSDAQNRRRANAGTADYNRLDVFKSDRWICQLCGEKIDFKLKDQHPMMASIDHIIPIAKGGKDVRKNVQSCHLVCNCRKNDRIGL